MPHPLLIVIQSDYLIQVVDTNSYIEWQTCRSRSVGFWRSHLIWSYTVCKDRAYSGPAGSGLRPSLFMDQFYFSQNAEDSLDLHCPHTVDSRYLEKIRKVLLKNTQTQKHHVWSYGDCSVRKLYLLIFVDSEGTHCPGHLQRLMTLVMLNKFRCHTHFLLSFSQITWSKLLIQIHILNGKHADPDQLASEEATWSGATLFAKTGHIRDQQDQG